jgi:hypothetical protein
VKSRLGPTRLVLLALAALGTAYFLTVALQSASYTITSHGLKMSGGRWAVLLGVFVLAFAALAAAGRAFPRFEIVPFLILLLTPTVFIHYWNRDDFRARLAALGLTAVLAALALTFAKKNPASQTAPSPTRRWAGRWSSLPTRRKLVVLFLAAFLVYNLCAGLFVLEGATFTGDEPNYLLMSHSLLYDRDLNLADNYANQDYFHFYSRQDNPHLTLGTYTQTGKKGPGHEYSINMPGTAVLMLPWYWLSQRLSGAWLTFVLKGSLSIWAVLLGLQLYLLARDLWRREGLAVGLWAVYAFSSPVLFYATHLYPEVPIALFSIYVYRKVTAPETPSALRLLGLGFLLGLFPWFGVKYQVFLGSLVLVGLYFLWKQHGLRAKILYFLAPPVVSVALFYLNIYVLFGSWSPFSLYFGAMTEARSQAFTQAALGLPLWARTDSFFGYLLDQRDGLLLYAPVYIFAILGLVELFRKSKRDLIVVLLILLPFLGNYALLAHRQGASPQGRPLAPLSWIGILLVGYVLTNNKNRIFSGLFVVSVLATLGATLLLLSHPSFLSQPTTHDITERAGDMFLYLSNQRIVLPALLPSFLKANNLGYVPNYFWLAGLCLIVIIYALVSRRIPKKTARALPLVMVSLGLAVVFVLWVFFPRVVLYPRQTFTYASGDRLAAYLFPAGPGVVAKNEGEFWLHAARAYKIVLGSAKKLSGLKLVFGSTAGREDAAIDFFDLPVFRGETANERKTIIYAPPVAATSGRLFFYEFNVAFRKLSDEDLAVDPYLFQVLPLR